jgi:hypothetical protein
MRKYFILLILLFLSSYTYAQDTFFNVGIGPDFMVKEVPNSYDGARFRIEAEIGEKYFAFVLQPAFGNGAFTLFLGPRLMLPFQVGSRPIFIIPDFTTGIDFGFGRDTVGTAIDFKFGFRIFYEFKPGMGLSFRPFGIGLRPFNVWFGNAPNQTQLSVTYEMSFGFSYFF